MEPSLKLSQKLSQTLTITQQMEQSIKILEMDMVELRDYIQNMALENPTIDMDGVQEDSPAELRKKKMEWLEQQAQKDKQYVGYYDPQKDYSLEKTVAAPQDESLVEHLRQQAVLNCTPEQQVVVEYLIGFVDDDGYLRTDIEEILRECRYSPKVIQAGLEILRSFDPPGVGATDLTHCLELQLPPEDKLARIIVKDYLDVVAKNRPDRVAKELNITKEQAAEAFARIRKLTPKPGSAFSPPDPPMYVTPVVVVTSFQDRYYVLPCEFSYPTIRLSGTMTDLMNSTDDKEVQQYISQKMKQAQWVQKCIASRGETLLSVAKTIVQCQERFFRYGPQYLNILRMSDVASLLGMHESTVSRAVKNKYLQCSHGTFPLKHFFVQGPKNTGTSEDASSHTIKCKIKELVAGEDKNAPLSDQKIADILAEQGAELSRRTVAKYRDQLGIPNSAYRR